MLNHRGGIDGDIVLDLDVLSNHCATVHVHILSNDTAFPDAGPFHHMGEVPNLCSRSDLGALISIGGFVHKVRPLLHFLFGSSPSSPTFPIPPSPLTTNQHSQSPEPFPP